MDISFRLWQKGFFICSPEKSIVPTFDDVSQFQETLEARSNFEAIDLYPRDGDTQLSATEVQIATLARAEPEGVVLFGSGMSAIETAIIASVSQEEHRSSGVTTIAHGRELYGQSLEYLNRYLGNQGVRLVSFDSGSAESVDNVLERHRPDVVFAETVGNGPNVPVLNIEALQDSLEAHVPQAITILDNTLPLSTELPISDRATISEKLITVESATKSYTFNTETAGLVSSSNKEIMNTIRSLRRTIGSRPGVASSRLIQTLLPKTVEQFDNRNREIYRNTGLIALYLFEAQQQGADVFVAHPSLDSHPNQTYVKDYHGSDISPVLFLQCIGQDNQFEVASRLWQNERVQEQAKIGQSFGFDDARILPDEHGPYVRIAGGASTDANKLGQALEEAILNK